MMIGQRSVVTRDGFRELRVRQLAKELAAEIYRVTDTGCLAKDHDLRDQMRRAAASIPSHTAEGDGRDTHRDSVRSLFIAKGSLAELRTQLEIARDVGSLPAEAHASLEARCAEIGRLPGSPIKARSASPHP
jgi:four helix bundle protein